MRYGGRGAQISSYEITKYRATTVELRIFLNFSENGSNGFDKWRVVNFVIPLLVRH